MQFKTYMRKPYPIYSMTKNAIYQYPINDQSGWKTIPHTYLLKRVLHTHLLKKVPPPPPLAHMLFITNADLFHTWLLTQKLQRHACTHRESTTVFKSSSQQSSYLFRLELKASRHSSYPWPAFWSLVTTKTSSRFTPDSLIACPTSASFLGKRMWTKRNQNNAKAELLIK